MINQGTFTTRIDCGQSWPSEEQTVAFRGHELRLAPDTEDESASISITYGENVGQVGATRVVQEFLSALAWERKDCFVAGASIATTGPPMRIGKGFAQTDSPPVTNVPEPEDDRAKLALAVYREALCSRMVTFKFLGFFKILNIVRRNGPEQIEWINSVIDELVDSDAVREIEELKKGHANLGQYLYGEGRCAVAHAWSDPIANPDEPEDTMRLGKELCVIKALAEYAIEHDLSVPASSSVTRPTMKLPPRDFP